MEPLALPALVSYVYLRVQTDSDGVPKFGTTGDGVTIEAFDEVKPSVHHVRPSPSGGEEDGDYYLLLLETESDGGTPAAPRVKKRIPGNRELPNQLVEITNIGGKREIYQGYLVGPDDKHEFRSLEQLEGDGEPIIKELDPGDPGGDPPVPAEEEGDTIPFRRIAQRATSPQVQVKDGGDVIRVEGNEYDQSFGGLVKALSVTDGLVTAFSDAGGANLNLTINAIDYDESGAIFGSPYLLHVLYFRDGLYIGNDDPEDEPDPLDEITILTVGV